MIAKAKMLLNLQSLEFGQTGNGTSPTHLKTIDKLRSDLSIQTLRHYDIKKQRYGESSLVPIVHGHCSGCNVNLSLRTLRASSTGVVECEHCGRLLYSASRHKRLFIEVVAA
jgi:predicted  nucleic acid-binding Zn-ribbon protein